LIAAYTLLPGLSQGNRDWGLFTSLTLLPSSSHPVLSLAWTLVFEMLFYIFFLVFYLTRHFWAVVSIWVSATVANAFLGLTDHIDSAMMQMLFNPLILEFVAGMIAALLYARLSPKIWAAPTLIGLSLASAYFIFDGGHRVLFGLSLAPLVLGLALAETHFRFRIPSVMLLLGGASYAIYLIHNPLQSLVARVVGDVENWLFTFAACVVAGVFVGIAYHLGFERPVLRWAGRRKSPHAQVTV
jgi:peptidoglycan/LPS O-acetylase OafA/YrhL